jgi:hypothetical protein
LCILKIICKFEKLKTTKIMDEFIAEYCQEAIEEVIKAQDYLVSIAKYCEANANLSKVEIALQEAVKLLKQK